MNGFGLFLLCLATVLTPVSSLLAAEPQTEPTAPARVQSAAISGRCSLLAPRAASHSNLRTWAMELLNHSGQRPVTKFGIELDENSPASATQPTTNPDRPLVILIHGYNSCPERLAPLAKTLREAGFACGALRYPNDQAIADSPLVLS